MCVKPLYLQQQETHVPCGKCLECKKKYINGWAFRIDEHLKAYQFKHCYFVTLTYAPEHCPSDYSLVWKDVQKFIKRLRYAVDGREKSTVAYYAVGEKGSKRGRPHYHLVLMGAPICDIQNSWGLGHVDIRPARCGAMQYMLKYVVKNERAKYGNFKRSMSKGIGKSYVDRCAAKHLVDPIARQFVTIDRTTKIMMPRYLKEKIFPPDVLNEIKRYNEQNPPEFDLLQNLNKKAADKSRLADHVRLLNSRKVE